MQPLKSQQRKALFAMQARVIGSLLLLLDIEQNTRVTRRR